VRDYPGGAEWSILFDCRPIQSSSNYLFAWWKRIGAEEAAGDLMPHCSRKEKCALAMSQDIYWATRD
jgi:hypothetical protein